jgi:hypothetical protein
MRAPTRHAHLNRSDAVEPQIGTDKHG